MLFQQKAVMELGRGSRISVLLYCFSFLHLRMIEKVCLDCCGCRVNVYIYQNLLNYSKVDAFYCM